MKPTKRAKKNLARQKLKLESERITKDETLENEVAVNSAYCRNEIGVLIMAIIFSPIMIFLIYCSGNQYDDVYQSQIENRKAEHTETASKNVVDSLVDSFIGNEPLNETKSEDTDNDTLKKHRAEAIKIDKNKQLSNEDYQKVLVSNIHYLEYINTVNKTREDLSNNKDKVDKEIRRLRVIPAVGGEAKEEFFINFVDSENDKPHSKDDSEKKLKKEMAVLWASENTEEGKLKLADAEKESQIIANKEPDANPTPTFIREHGISLFILLYAMWGSLQYNDYRKDKKRRLVYVEEDESQSEVAPTILKINNHKDLNRYSNKL